jgi:hypothetical protein
MCDGRIVDELTPAERSRALDLVGVAEQRRPRRTT